MTLRSDLTEYVSKTFLEQWVTENGTKVPEPTDLRLGNHGKLLDGVVLYADLEDSTGLVNARSRGFAAEVFKTYLHGCCQIIRSKGGVITSFDGDRVMGVFLGGTKNSNAAAAGLMINDFVANILNPGLNSVYSKIPYQVKHVVGIDAGSILAARTGIRNSNDVVWVSPASNYAAKMCSIRGTSFRTIISESVYKSLNEASKLGGTKKENMWQEFIWAAESRKVYGSSWRWTV